MKMMRVVSNFFPLSARLVIFETFFGCKKKRANEATNYINVCDDAFWKAGQMFRMIFPSFFNAILLRLPFPNKCVDYFLCVYPSTLLFFYSSPGPQSTDSSFRRALCRVNWSRGLLNWFWNHILWKFTNFFFLNSFHLRSQLILQKLRQWK